EAIGRLVSLSLRSGIPLMEIHRQLRGISSDRAVGLGPNKVLSMPDAIGIALEQWWREKQGVQTDLLAPPAPSPVSSLQPPMPVMVRPTLGGAQMQSGQQADFSSGHGEVFMGTCPDCGSQLEFAEGCVKCHVCGYSECG
ncbi:MAG: response regulator SirA, partial [Gemmatimonadaceae bacterium]